MAKNTKLSAYRRKRNFRKTREPRGSSSKSNKKPLFVIQKHDASTLHYDFRLEIDGVFKSWAVPKGPSTDPSEKRYATMTEEHPLSYADFEGVIPEEEYGGGTVMVWDRGTYRNLQREKDERMTMNGAVRRGKMEVWLEGEKIAGGYALVRTSKKQNRWLLIKMDDSEADRRRNPVNSEPRSVLSGRTIQQIAKQGKKTE